MAITKVEELEDRVIISYYFRNGEAIEDEEGNKVIFYKDIPNLEKEPELPTNNDRNFWREEFELTKIGKKLSYHFVDWPETSMARMSGFLGGPYLVE